MVCQEKLWW